MKGMECSCRFLLPVLCHSLPDGDLNNIPSVIPCSDPESHQDNTRDCGSVSAMTTVFKVGVIPRSMRNFNILPSVIPCSDTESHQYVTRDCGSVPAMTTFFKVGVIPHLMQNIKRMYQQQRS